MKVSYNWLNSRYFDGKLPSPEKVAEELTFHAWEIEEIEAVGNDTLIDVKVLPDKAMWALSHRGIAKDLSVILDLPMRNDPLQAVPSLEPKTSEVEIRVDSPNCRRFATALIKGVKVGPSPEWLRSYLETIGQRSINNIVDASNFVMFDLGQPSHAFDAKNLPGGVLVRQAGDGEKLAALDENEYTFTDKDTLISSLDGQALSIAGIKGGKDSGINDSTADILVEVANWDPVTTRKTAARLKLRSDASSRYENGIVPDMVPYGLKAVTELILEVAGGSLVGYADTGGKEAEETKVTVDLAKINSVLGIGLTAEEVSSIMGRFGWEYEVSGETFTVISPFERTDLKIAEDVIEEVGRVYGYLHVEAVTPAPVPARELNKRFFYSEKIRNVLLGLGFSEIYTSSFREKDMVKMQNAFAADKGYLRSSLTENMREALVKNAPNADLLGLRQIKLFELGTVFTDKEESYMLALGVCGPSGYKAKADDPALLTAIDAVSREFERDITGEGKEGVIEINFGTLIEELPQPTAYEQAATPKNVTYRPYSIYPATSRDIAMWVGGGESEEAIVALLRQHAGDLCVRVTIFDRFEKEGRVSYAFRLVFQSKEKTLEGSEVDSVMEDVYQAVRERGFEVR